jgi:NTP pyrophosphatase (non-canonical NTP hydrolase)
MSNCGRKPLEYKPELKAELGDALYSLITVANTFDIDLEDAGQAEIEKYQEGIQHHGNAGSQP